MLKPSLLFYCQHSLGLGHLARSWTIAKALSSRFQVTICCGGPLPAGLEPPSCCEIVALPPMAVTENGQLTSLDARHSVESALDARRDIMLAELARRPAVIVVELFPFGRKKFGRELLPVLEAARAVVPRPVVVCSLRDILVARGDRQADHDERARALVDRHFDAVLLHADPAFARLDEFFSPTQPMSTPVHYTGFVAGAPPARHGSDRSGILVSGGGGRFAEALFLTAIEAHRYVSNAPAMTVVTGPLCEPGTWERLAAAASGNPSIRLTRVVADLSADMATSRLSISQCGYNTALDIVRAGVPALVVPFAARGETEQMDRARRLEALGVLRVLPPDDLDAVALAAAAEDTLGFSPAAFTLDLGGADRTAQLLDAFVRGIPADAGHLVAHEHLA